MARVENYDIVHNLNIQIVTLQDENAYLKMQLEQLRKVSVFYEQELEKILDHEDYTKVVNECMHMLLLDPYKYDEDDEDPDDE